MLSAELLPQSRLWLDGDFIIIYRIPPSNMFHSLKESTASGNDNCCSDIPGWRSALRTYPGLYAIAPLGQCFSLIISDLINEWRSSLRQGIRNVAFLRSCATECRPGLSLRSFFERVSEMTVFTFQAAPSISSLLTPIRSLRVLR